MGRALLLAAFEALKYTESSRAFELFQMYHRCFFVSQTKINCHSRHRLLQCNKNGDYLTKAHSMSEPVFIFLSSLGLALLGRLLRSMPPAKSVAPECKNK